MTESDDQRIDFAWGQKIPVRGGIHLNASLYRPRASEPVPAVFFLSPYTTDPNHAAALYFAQQGYAFAAVDARGRGNSEGEYLPIFGWGEDGHDVAEWLAQQPWCDGSVAMWGGSALGGTQWMTLKNHPVHLKTIVPVASIGPGIDVPYFNNIFRTYEMQWLTLTSGHTQNAAMFADQDFWNGIYRDLYLNHIPYNQLDQLAGNPSTIFQQWVSEPTPQIYLDSVQPTAEDYRQIDIPILTITGHYDDDQPGAMHYYQQHMRWGTPEAIARHYLVIGPWDHGGTRRPSRQLGGVSFAEAALVDMNALHKAWYDWTLKDGPQPEFLKKRVVYYVMGAEEWRYADNLESIPIETRSLYLNSTDGQANDVFHSGMLTPEPPQASLPDNFIYDPLDTRPAALEMEPIEKWLTDQRYDLNLMGNGLVYHSAPFEQPVEITGFVRLECWMAMDVPDTDFQVTLAEILPDGTRILLTQDWMRARYRDSLLEETLVEPGDINHYVFDSFTFFSRQIASGSRLRLIIQCPNSINFQKNYNSGGVVAEESAADARTAHITLYHDADHLAVLALPVAHP